MATAALAGRVLATLVTELQKMGTGVAGTWLTAPEVKSGVPNDPLPQPTVPRVYVTWHGEEPDQEVPLGRHGQRMVFHVWLTAASLATLLDLDWDVKHAMKDAEAAFGMSYGTLPEDGGVQRQREMEGAGLFVAVRTVLVPVEYDHGSF